MVPVRNPTGAREVVIAVADERWGTDTARVTRSVGAAKGVEVPVDV